jgi:hypothetical protein
VWQLLKVALMCLVEWVNEGDHFRRQKGDFCVWMSVLNCFMSTNSIIQYEKGTKGLTTSCKIVHLLNFVCEAIVGTVHNYFAMNPKPLSVGQKTGRLGGLC